MPEFPKIEYKNFNGGINTYTDRGELMSNQYVKGKGFFLKDGSMFHPGGTALVSQSSFNQWDFERWTNQAKTSKNVLWSALNSGSGKIQIYTAVEGNNAPTLLKEWTPASDYTSFRTPTFEDMCMFTCGDSSGYIANCGDRIELFDPKTGLVHDAGVGPTTVKLVTMQYEAAANGPIVPANSPDGYGWIFIEEDEFGQINNPFDVSFRYVISNITAASNARLKISGVTTTSYNGGPAPSLGSGYAVGTAGKGKVWAYRIGGSNALMRFSFKFTPNIATAVGVGPVSGMAIAIGDILDNATGDFPLDTISDGLLPDTFLSLKNLPPPVGIRCGAFHQQRIYFAGYGYTIPAGGSGSYVTGGCISGSHLWMTRQNQLGSVGSDDNGVDDDGGFVILDGSSDDDIMSLCSLTGLLVIGRRKSIYVMYGDRFSNFRFEKRSNLGVSSRKSLVANESSIRWLATDRTIRELRDSDSINISVKVQSLLSGIPDANLSSAVCWYADSRFYISCPIGGGNVLCLCYDERINTSATPYEPRVSPWTDLSYSDFSAFSAKETTNPVTTVKELWVSRTTGGTYNTNIQGVSNDIPFEFETDYKFFGDAGMTGRMISYFLMGSITNGIISPIQADLTCGNIVYTYSLQSPTGNMFNFTRLQHDLIGDGMKVRVYGTWRAGSISNMSIGYVPQRELNR